MTVAAPLTTPHNPDNTPGTVTKPTPTNPVSGDVPATLKFHGPTSDGAPPYHYVGPPPAGIQSSNERQNPHQVTIHDLRGLESQFHLDKQSFQPLQNVPSAETAFLDESRIKNTYYPEIQSLITAHVPGAQDVVIFDHTIRRSTPGADRAPVFIVHIDQTVAAAYERARLHLPEHRAEDVISGRVRARIINVWRPINGPVVNNPLAFADSRTVEEENIVSVRHIYPEREGGTCAVEYNPGQKWWYWSGQRNDEVVLLKCFDTDVAVGGGAPGRRGRAPHTAFEHPGTPEGSIGRESIEVRCLVIG